LGSKQEKPAKKGKKKFVRVYSSSAGMETNPDRIRLFGGRKIRETERPKRGGGSGKRGEVQLSRA